MRGKVIVLDRIKSIARAVSGAWSRGGKIYIDMLPLDDATLSKYSNHPMEELFNYFRGKEYSLNAIPVISLDSTKNKRAVISNICKADKKGAMVRVGITNLADISRPGSMIAKELADICSDIGLGEDSIDIMIDLGEVGEITFNAFGAVMLTIINAFPKLKDWRSIIISSGAFPGVINSVAYGSQGDFNRYDYLLWQKVLNDNPDRKPAFADYTCVSLRVIEIKSDFVEVPPNTRYALDSVWRVYRDESNVRKKNLNSYFNQCLRLVSDTHTFMGAGYSEGDQDLELKSKYAGVLPLPSGIGVGNSQIWRRNDINHHIIFTSRQILAVP